MQKVRGIDVLLYVKQTRHDLVWVEPLHKQVMYLRTRKSLVDNLHSGDIQTHVPVLIQAEPA